MCYINIIVIIIYSLLQNSFSFILSHFLSNSCKISCSDAYFIIHFILKRSFHNKIRRFKPLFYYHLNNLPRCILKPLTELANSLKSKVSLYLPYHIYGGRGYMCTEMVWCKRSNFQNQKKFQKKIIDKYKNN